MKDNEKTREHLLQELQELRTRNAELETAVQQEIKKHEQTGEALRESREYARNIIESSLDMIIAVDQHRQIIEFNKAAQEDFGYSREEMLGKPIDVIYADPGQAETVQQMMSEEGQCIGEILNKRKNGEIFPCLLSASILRNASGEPVGSMGISRDITEQKKTEEALRESEEKYRGLFESLHDVFYRADIMGNIMLVSPSVTRLLGYPLNEVTGLNLIKDFYTTVEQRREFMTIMNTQGYIEGFEIQLKRKDGAKIWVSSNSHLYKNKEGRVLGIEGIFRDITQRKQAEAELLAAHNQLKETLENLQRTQAQLLQSERMAALGQLVSGIAHEINTPAGAIVSAIHELDVSYTRLLERLQFVLLNLPQELRERYMTACRHALLTEKDLSTRDRRQIARNIQNTLEQCGITLPYKLCKQLTMIGFTEHELETMFPLFNSPEYKHIHNSLYLLGMTRVHIKNIKISIELINQLINALKHYSQLDKGVLIETDLRRDLDSTLLILQHRLRRITVHKDYDHDIPAFACEAAQLNQVWTNLLQNAVQAMKGEGELYVRSKRKDGEWLMVEIEDTGPGIPDEIRAQIFEPYFTTRSSHDKGIGMGLTICQQIIEQHNGRIEVVSSEPGKTCFRVTLPLSNNSIFSEMKNSTPNKGQTACSV